MGKRSVAVEVTPKQRAVLEPLTRAKLAPQQLVERCHVILMSAEGRNNEDQADELGVDRQRVRRWRHRWAKASAALVAAEHEGATDKDLEKLILRELADDDRCGAPPSLDDLRSRTLQFIEYFNKVLAKPFRWTYTGRPLQT